MHRFTRYFQRHGHYPRARVKVGTARTDKHIEMTVTPTYLTVRMHPYGSPITIPRRQLITLIKWLVPLVHEMEKDPAKQFDPEAALEEYLAAEESHDRELRQLKRDLYGTRRARRGHARRAKRR